MRISGALALAAIVASWRRPEVATLAAFVLLTMWTNGPHSPVLPASYEPLLMLYGLVYPPALVGALGTAGIVFIELINYRLYAGAVDFRAVQALRESRQVALLSRLFRRRPFLTIVVCAVSPLPFWVARVLSVLASYSVCRHLAATALGRFPRLWFFAALSAPLGITDAWLVGMTAGSLALAGVLLLVRRLRASRTGAASDSVAPPQPTEQLATRRPHLVPRVVTHHG